jgi:hypothetical protein
MQACFWTYIPEAMLRKLLLARTEMPMLFITSQISITDYLPIIVNSLLTAFPSNNFRMPIGQTQPRDNSIPNMTYDIIYDETIRCYNWERFST